MPSAAAQQVPDRDLWLGRDQRRPSLVGFGETLILSRLSISTWQLGKVVPTGLSAWLRHFVATCPTRQNRKKQYLIESILSGAKLSQKTRLRPAFAVRQHPVYKSERTRVRGVSGDG